MPRGGQGSVKRPRIKRSSDLNEEPCGTEGDRAIKRRKTGGKLN
jgi:hypothetical protein